MKTMKKVEFRRELPIVLEAVQIGISPPITILEHGKPAGGIVSSAEAEFASVVRRLSKPDAELSNEMLASILERWMFQLRNSEEAVTLAVVLDQILDEATVVSDYHRLQKKL